MARPLLRVLVVDDDEDDFLLARADLLALPGREVRVEWCSTWDAARARITAREHDLYLVDQHLGARTGLELVREAQSDSDAPFILLTGHAGEEVEQAAAEAGAADFLVKGRTDPDRLDRSIRFALERARHLRALRLQAEELRRSNAELEAFASVAAHELRGPLQVVSLYAEVVQHELGDAAGPEGTRMAAGIVEAVGRMRILLDELLAYARVSASSREWEPVDTAACVTSALSGLGSRLRDTGGTVEVGDLPLVEGNPTQLTQLFCNLLENAVKFGGRPVRVEVHAEPEGDRHAFRVRDHGPGIPPDQAEAVFRMFHRLRPHETDGTGIGLALCRRIVERHGGRIAVHPAAGGGAEFRFTLPALGAVPPWSVDPGT